MSKVRSRTFSADYVEKVVYEKRNVCSLLIVLFEN
jgi:hypothetical protein